MTPDARRAALTRLAHLTNRYDTAAARGDHRTMEYLTAEITAVYRALSRDDANQEVTP